MNGLLWSKVLNAERVHKDIGPAIMPLLVNECRRSIKYPGLLGARIRAGTIRKEASGVGDSLLINFRNRFFAIADSSDRNPVFGRDFMQRFSKFIAGFKLFRPGTYTEKAIDRVKNSIILKSATMLRLLPFHGSCAFTGLILLGTYPGMGALLFHAGDTGLFMKIPGDRISLMTKKNFWLVGKTSAFFQMEFVRIEPGTRFLFITDGFYGLSPLSGREPVSLMEELLQNSPIEDIPDAFIDLCHHPGSGKDDVALIALEPGGPFPQARPILLGGTSASAERKRRLREKEMPDLYEPRQTDGDWHAFL